MPLTSLFHALISDIEPIAREKGLILTMRDTSAAVTSDPLMLRRMLQNLLVNAVRYSERGEVKLAARRRGRVDPRRGVGHRPRHRGQRAEAHLRGVPARSGSETGGRRRLRVGTVDRAAHGRHAGAPGRAVLARWPRHPVLDPRPLCRVDLLRDGETNGTTQPAAPVPVYGFGETRVVVIDNDTAILTAMSELLGQWGCETRVVRHLEELEDIVAEPGFKADIILADYHLDHGENGLDAVRMLRNAWNVDIPAILVTADHTAATEVAARQSRCDLLRKPRSPAELGR